MYEEELKFPNENPDLDPLSPLSEQKVKCQGHTDAGCCFMIRQWLNNMYDRFLVVRHDKIMVCQL